MFSDDANSRKKKIIFEKNNLGKKLGNFFFRGKQFLETKNSGEKFSEEKNKGFFSAGGDLWEKIDGKNFVGKKICEEKFGGKKM